MKRSLVLIVVLAACNGSMPKYDDSLVVPAAKGLKVGVATLDDVTKAFPDAELAKDKSLGGEGIVMYGDHKAIHFHGADAGGDIVEGKLVHFVVHAPGLHDWLVQKMDSMAGSKDACPGNRKMGQSGPGDAVYCAADGDRVVFIEGMKGSDRDSLEYNLAK